VRLYIYIYIYIYILKKKGGLEREIWQDREVGRGVGVSQEGWWGLRGAWEGLWEKTRLFYQAFEEDSACVDEDSLFTMIFIFLIWMA